MPLKPDRSRHQIFGIKNCDSMKKTFAWLNANNINYEFIDYKKSGVVARHLPDWNQRAGWKLLLNTRGLTWRKLDDLQRTDIDEAKALALMTEYPCLIKRPVVDCGGRLLVGFDPERYRVELMQNLEPEGSI